MKRYKDLITETVRLFRMGQKAKITNLNMNWGNDEEDNSWYRPSDPTGLSGAYVKINKYHDPTKSPSATKKYRWRKYGVGYEPYHLGVDFDIADDDARDAAIKKRTGKNARQYVSATILTGPHKSNVYVFS